MALFILKESLSPEIRARVAARPARRRWAVLVEVLGRPAVGLLIGASFLATFVFAGMEATFAMWSERSFAWGPEQNGYLFGFVGTMSALIQGLLMGRLARRFGEPRLIVQGAVALAVGVALIPFSTSLPVLLVAMAVLAYGFSVINPSLNSLISLGVGEDERGAVLGVARSATTLARVVGPAWAGLLFSILGKDWPYFAGAVVMLGVLVLGLKVARHPDIPRQ